MSEWKMTAEQMMILAIAEAITKSREVHWLY